MPTAEELKAKFRKALQSDMTVMLGLDGLEDGHTRPMTAQVEGDHGPIWLAGATGFPTNASMKASPSARTERRERSRRKLGGAANLLEEFPDRPLGMHRKTYAKLEELDDDMQGRWARAVLTRLAKQR